MQTIARVKGSVVATNMETGITKTYNNQTDFYTMVGYDEGEEMLNGKHDTVTAVVIL